MRQVFIIAWREYRQYVFSRGFLIFLIMLPLSMIALGAAMSVVERAKPVRAFAVYDETGRYIDHIDREIERRRQLAAIAAWDEYISVYTLSDGPGTDQIPAPFAPDDVDDARLRAFEAAGGFDAATRAAAPHLRRGAPAFAPPRGGFERVALPGAAASASSMDEATAGLRPFLMGEFGVKRRDGDVGPLFAAILIPRDFGPGEDAPAAQYWSRNLTDAALEGLVNSALDSALKREAAERFGMPQERLEELAAIAAPLDAFRPDRANEEAALGMRDRIETALPAVLTYMLLVVIFGVGNLLLTNTIEERSNKIVEILLSSVTADQLMLGKLFGIAAVGLTMPAIFLVGGLGASLAAGGAESVPALALSMLFSSPLWLIYLFYFVCAYGIFAMIFLAIGAVSNSLQDAQSYMGPVMLIVFAPLPFMMLVFQNPNGVVASILTWIPIYTPYAVMMRAAADPPLWEIAGATSLMLAFAIVLMRFMGRIFRNAILQSSPMKAREAWRLARGEA